MTEKAQKAPNYTEAMIETLHAEYVPGSNESVDALAEKLNRKRRSVIAKLVAEGIYVKPEAPVATFKDDGPTKGEMLNHLDSLVTFDTDGLKGATKDAIAGVIALAEAAYAETDDGQPEAE